MPQQPDHFDVAMGLCFQTPARPYPVQIAVDLNFAQVGRSKAWPTGFSRLHVNEAGSLEIEAIDESLDKTDRGLSGPT